MADFGKAAYQLAKTSTFKRLIGNTSIGFGDSITAGTYGAAPYYDQLVIRSKGLLRSIRNAAVGGNNTTQMLARLKTDVLDYKPQICFFMAGTNNVGQNYDQSVTDAEYEAIVVRLLENGITPIVGTIPPRGDTQYHLATAKVNALVRRMGIKYNLIVLDFFSSLVDPATNKYLTAYDVDLVHPNAAGAKQMAIKAGEMLYPLLAPTKKFLPDSNIDPLSLLRNGLFVKDTDSDGIPDNVVVGGAGTSTSSLITNDTAIIGNWSSHEISGVRNFNLDFISTGFSAGDRLAFVGNVRADIEAGAMSFHVQLKYSPSQVSIRPLSSWTTDVDGTFYTESVVPEGTTNFAVSIQALSGTGTLKISQFGVYNLSQNRLI